MAGYCAINSEYFDHIQEKLQAKGFFFFPKKFRRKITPRKLMI